MRNEAVPMQNWCETYDPRTDSRTFAYLADEFVVEDSFQHSFRKLPIEEKREAWAKAKRRATKTGEKPCIDDRDFTRSVPTMRF